MLDDALFLMAGGGRRADWVRNIEANASVKVRIGAVTFEGRGEIAPDGVDEESVRRAMATEYQGWRPGDPLSEWAESALVVRVRAVRKS